MAIHVLNWLFSGHPREADASAGIYSLIETAKPNGLEPYRYLRHLFEALAGGKPPTPSARPSCLNISIPAPRLSLPKLLPLSSVLTRCSLLGAYVQAYVAGMRAAIGRCPFINVSSYQGVGARRNCRYKKNGIASLQKKRHPAFLETAAQPMLQTGGELLSVESLAYIGIVFAIALFIEMQCTDILKFHVGTEGDNIFQ